MTFTEHLVELRKRLVRMTLGVLVGLFAAFAYSQELFQFVAWPMKQALAKHGVYAFRSIEITETIMVYLKLSLVAGIFLTLPYTFYQLWAFIAPGLLEKEKRAITPLLFFSTLFFLLGGYFAYAVAIPFSAEYLAAFTLSTPDIQLDVTVASAFSFSILLLLAFGATFELPLIMFFLSLLGIADHKRYLKFFRYYVVIAFVISGIVTPTPDPLNQTVLAVPLIGLYFVGVLGAWFISKRKKAGVGTFAVPSRVWSILSITLVLIGGGIAAGTWYIGRSHSPLRWIPDDARWVASVRLSTVLGVSPPPERLAALKAHLPMPAEVPEVERVLVVEGPDGERLLVLEGGCARAVPSLGSCAEDDLLVGDAAFVERAAKAETSITSNAAVRELETQAPAWVWQHPAVPSTLAAIPGSGEAAPDVTELSVTSDLGGDAPWIELAARGKDASAALSLQSRVDLWRMERARLKAQSTRDQASTAGEKELLELVTEALAVEDDRFALTSRGTRDPDALARIERRHAHLRERLAASRARLLPPPPPPPGASLLERLGDDAVRDWRVSVDGDRMRLRVSLQPPSGVEKLLALLPK